MNRAESCAFLASLALVGVAGCLFGFGEEEGSEIMVFARGLDEEPRQPVNLTENETGALGEIADNLHKAQGNSRSVLVANLSRDEYENEVRPTLQSRFRAAYDSPYPNRFSVGFRGGFYELVFEVTV